VRAHTQKSNAHVLVQRGSPLTVDYGPYYAGLLCDLLWSDPDKDISGWGENDRGVSFTFGADVVTKFLQKHDMDLICRAHQVVEDGYEFFAKRQLVTLFSAPNYCVAEDDMQLLTSDGWKFLDEMEAAWAAAQATGKPLLAAGYNAKERALVYEQPSRLVVNKAAKQTLVDITPRGPSGQSWWDSNGSDSASAGRAAVRNGVSLRVTPDHVMYAKLGNAREDGTGYTWRTKPTGTSRRQAEADYEKMPASALLASEYAVARFPARAANGVATAPAAATLGEDAPAAALAAASALPYSVAANAAFGALGLTTEAQCTAFVTLYGYWLGDGAREDAAAVRVSASADRDVAAITAALATLGLAMRAERHLTGKQQWSIDQPAWAAAFRAQELLPWVHELPAPLLRALLGGLTRTDGTAAETRSVDASTVRFRDEVGRLGLHAGYAVRVEGLSKKAAQRSGQDGWRVVLSAHAAAAEPVVARTDMKEVAYEGRTWCLTMPSGFVWARRATRDLRKVSRPAIVGNCGEFDNAGAMMSVDDTLMCSFQILKPAEKKQKYAYAGGPNSNKQNAPPRAGKKKKEGGKA
jgi:hypothetical protein